MAPGPATLSLAGSVHFQLLPTLCEVLFVVAALVLRGARSLGGYQAIMPLPPHTNVHTGAHFISAARKRNGERNRHEAPAGGQRYRGSQRQHCLHADPYDVALVSVFT